MLAGLGALLLLAVPVHAGPGPGGVSSDNVTYVSTVPLEAGGPSGARVIGKHLYVAGFKNFSIYDISDPVAPALLSFTPTGFQFPNEDVDTNGKILLIGEETPRGMLHIYDVENKAGPTKIAEIAANDHTFSCIDRCKWAYGGYGTIIDLRDPANPEIAGDWGSSATYTSFDVTEAARGRVITASQPLTVLDSSKANSPELVATGPAPDQRLMHAVRWPNRGKDDFVLVTGETPFSVRCDGDSGAFMTFDASRWRKTRTLTMIDEYRLENGTSLDGRPPVNAIGCSALWFSEHPDFSDGGLVAGAFLEHGVRILNVDAKGHISEKGYFTPNGGSVVAAYWITDEIVYSIDLVRGIDILRVEVS